MPKTLSGRRTRIAVIALLVLQALCTLFFITELATEVLGLRHWALSWELRELLQVLASAGLLVGTLMGAWLLRLVLVRARDVERQLRAASGAFFAALDDAFTEWGLSPSEREVALAAVRGLSNAEIGDMRGTSDSTVKSQMNAVYRKAGVSNRAQLLSHFVDLLIAEES